MKRLFPCLSYACSRFGRFSDVLLRYWIIFHSGYGLKLCQHNHRSFGDGTLWSLPESSIISIAGDCPSGVRDCSGSRRPAGRRAAAGGGASVRKRLYFRLGRAAPIAESPAGPVRFGRRCLRGAGWLQPQKSLPGTPICLYSAYLCICSA